MKGPAISALITNCSARKTAKSAAGLNFADLETGPQEDIARQWRAALERAPVVARAADLYCGRGIQRVHRLAERLGAPMFIASAGLGLVRDEERVPSYDLSVSASAPSAVQRRVAGGFSAKDWWVSLQQSRYAVPIREVLAESASDGLILIALSSGYVPLLADQLHQLEPGQRERLRLFGAVDSKYPPDLLPLLMPYDARLDALIRGSKVDFAQRAAEHFVVGCVSDQEFPLGLQQQRGWVEAKLAKVAVQSVTRRQTLADVEIRAIAAKLAAQGVRQTKALTILRRERGIACEQSRFRRLFLEATR